MAKKPLNYLNTSEFDLIVTDTNMPEMGMAGTN